VVEIDAYFTGAAIGGPAFKRAGNFSPEMISAIWKSALSCSAFQLIQFLCCKTGFGYNIAARCWKAVIERAVVAYTDPS